MCGVDDCSFFSHSRLPNIVDEFLKVALPYAFWARGDIQHATELFCQLSQSENRCTYRNMLVYRVVVSLFF